MSIFGWSLPPGCTQSMIDNMYADRPCEVCGLWPDDCVCPECKQCGEYGNPRCYDAHGMVRSEEQIASLRAKEAEWEAVNRDEHLWACREFLCDWMGVPEWELPKMSDIELECRNDIALAACGLDD